MNSITSILGEYYGLDWLTLMMGVTGSFMMSSGKLREGFILAVCACTCGLAVAAMSHQYGFVVYNFLLIALNARGLIRGDRREMKAEEMQTTPASFARQAMPASVAGPVPAQ